MPKRPLSVSIIARLLIVLGAVNLFMTIAYFNHPAVRAALERNPLPIPVQYAMGIVGLSVMVVSGLAMLRGRHWGRVLYIAWTLFGTLVGLFTVPQKLTLIPGFVLFLIMVFFLFRPAANTFFRSAPADGTLQDDAPQVDA